MNARIVAVVCALALSTSLVRPALADPQECIAANERGGAFKARGEFKAARAEYQACANEICPKVIREECASLTSVVDAATPSVILVAVDAQGNDAVDVRVEVDGRPHAPGVDGRVTSLDPGEHVFRFRRGVAMREVRAIVREGEKGRAIQVRFDAAAQAPAHSSEQDALGSAAATTLTRPIPPLAYALAGAGVLALGSFSYFAIAGNAQKNELQQRCAPNCRLDEADAMQTKYLAADLSLAIAAVSLGGATYLYITRPAAAEPSANALLRPTGDGLQLGVRGRF